MRTQQRKFVVEVKSSRRRLAATPKSIWESTDLKALIRAAEAEAEPPLGSENEVPQSGDHPGVVQDKPVALDAVEVAYAAEQIPPGSPVAQNEAVAETQLSVEREVVTNSSASLESSKTPRRIARLPKRQQQKRLPRAGEAGTSGETPAHVVDGLAADDLVMLDRENRRLKALLREQIIEENKLLRMMLSRF